MIGRIAVNSFDKPVRISVFVFVFVFVFLVVLFVHASFSLVPSFFSAILKAFCRGKVR